MVCSDAQNEDVQCSWYEPIDSTKCVDDFDYYYFHTCKYRAMGALGASRCTNFLARNQAIRVSIAQALGIPLDIKVPLLSDVELRAKAALVLDTWRQEEEK
jgi:hypothetical protein